MSFPPNIICFWVNSTEKQPIAFPAKTAIGEKKKKKSKKQVLENIQWQNQESRMWEVTSN